MAEWGGMGRKEFPGVFCFFELMTVFECWRAAGVSERVACRGVLRDLHLWGNTASGGQR